MNFFKKNVLPVILSTFLMLIVFAPYLALAEDSTASVPNPLAGNGVNTVQGLIKMILEGLIKIGIPIIALALVYSGFLFVAAKGNDEKLKKAKDALFYTIIGAAVILGSWAIAQLIHDTVLKL